MQALKQKAGRRIAGDKVVAAGDEEAWLPLRSSWLGVDQGLRDRTPEHRSWTDRLTCPESVEVVTTCTAPSPSLPATLAVIVVPTATPSTCRPHPPWPRCHRSTTRSPGARSGGSRPCRRPVRELQFLVEKHRAVAGEIVTVAGEPGQLGQSSLHAEPIRPVIRTAPARRSTTVLACRFLGETRANAGPQGLVKRLELSSGC